MKKNYLPFIGIIALIGLIVSISGCTTQLTTPSEQKLIYKGDVGGSGTQTTYIHVNASKVTIEISNTTVIPNKYWSTQYYDLDIYALDVVGQKGQSPGNYVDNIVDSKYFNELTNGYITNTTLKGNIKSIAIAPTDTKVYIKIFAN